MKKTLGDMFLGLFVDKKARENIKKRRKAKTREGQISDLRETVDRVMTPERRELIKRAMEVQRAKSKILDDLNDEDKRRLYAFAIKNLLREGDTPEEK